MKQIFVSLAAQNALFSAQKVIFACSSTLKAIALFCLIKQTPPHQAAIRNYLILTQVTIIAFDILIDVGAEPMPLFPIAAAYCCGWLVDWGVPMLYIMALIVVHVWNIVVSIIMCCVYRHQAILLPASPFKLSKRTSILLNVSVPLMFYTCTLLYALQPVDTELIEQLVDRHNLSWIRTRCKYNIEPSSFLLSFFAWGAAALSLSAVLVTIILFVHMYHLLHLEYSKRSSTSAKAIQKSLKTLFVQLFIPQCMLGGPTIIIFVGIATEDLVSFELSLIMVYVILCHSIVHNLILLFITKPYREWIVGILRCTANDFLRKATIKSAYMSALNFVTDFNQCLKPLAPVILVLGNLFGCFIVIVLLKVLSMTRLHVNCKFLLNSWSICFITMFILHIVMFVLNFSMDELPKNKADPPIRISLYTIIISMQLITTIYELCIATERLISSIRPKEYYARALDRKYLYPATLAITGCLMICQYYMTEGGNHTLFSVIVLSLDLFTISVNEFAIKYGTRRFEQMQGKTTLNGRYQVKESSQLAKAMQPVYICSFTLKLILFAPVLVFCYETNEEYDCVSRWFYIPFAYMELAYFGTLTAASVFVIAYFIRIHPRLRRRAEKLYQTIRGIPVTDEPSEPFVMQERASEFDIYFVKLVRVWDEGLKGVK